MASIIGQMKQLARASINARTEDADMLTVPVGIVKEVPVGHQQVLYGELVVNGSYVVNGTLIVDAIPT